MKFSASKQSGFTLVEIAIVLVIIGVLLAGVLKGQSLINNARVKGIVNDMNGVSAAYNGYIDRYRNTPGTELSAAVNTRGWLTTVNGITPLALPVGTTFNTTLAQTAFWQVLGASGFFTTSQNQTVNPASANGGKIGVAITPYLGVPGVAVCVSNITSLQAEGVDTIVDGQLPANNIGSNVGNLQGAANANPPLAPSGGNAPATVYNENSGLFWTQCRAL